MRVRRIVRALARAAHSFRAGGTTGCVFVTRHRRIESSRHLHAVAPVTGAARRVAANAVNALLGLSADRFLGRPKIWEVEEAGESFAGSMAAHFWKGKPKAKKNKTGVPIKNPRIGSTLLFIVDANGHIAALRTGETRPSKHHKNRIIQEKVIIYGRDYREFIVWILIKGPAGYEDNCHGFVFVDGEYWIQPENLGDFLDAFMKPHADQSNPQPTAQRPVIAVFGSDNAHSGFLVVLNDGTLAVVGDDGGMDAGVGMSVDDYEKKYGKVTYYEFDLEKLKAIRAQSDNDGRAGCD